VSAFATQLFYNKEKRMEIKEKINKRPLKHNDSEIRLPILCTRGFVAFPNATIQFDVNRKKSISAIQEAVDKNRLIFVIAQTDLSDDEPKGDNLSKTGVIAKVCQIIQHDSNGTRIMIEGQSRGKINSIYMKEPYLAGSISEIDIQKTESNTRSLAAVRMARNKFEDYIQDFKHFPPDVVMNVMKEKDCGVLADILAGNIHIDYEKKQEILDEYDSIKRIIKMINILTEEIKINEIETEIEKKAQEDINDNQREYILREQLKIISDELGDSDNPQEEADEYRKAIESLEMGDDSKEKILSECDRLFKMPVGSHEASVIRSYLDTVIELPWNKRTSINIDINKAKKILDRDHYGMEKVKERFLEILSVEKLTNKIGSQIICLVGPPGVGKTSVAKSIAEATGRKYVRVSLGGIQDEADIVGHRKTYVGSMPGRIISAIKQSGVKNPLILLDEIDKLGLSFKGDPSSSLLEVLDTEQNKAFYDHYIDLPFDLSEILFITTANDPSTIPAPLYDRMDVITLGSYTHDEKFNIAIKFLIPKQLKQHGIQKKQLKISDQAVHDMIDNYTREAGVRNLERTIASLCRKVAREIVTNNDFRSLKIKATDLEKYLGPRKYTNESALLTDEIGLVNGLAWTSVGGEMLPIEVAVMEGTGKIQLTGSLGDVMKESANAAITWIRTVAPKYKIKKNFYSKYDIHIHAPEGAVPKDGPSAGVAMATAIASALTKIPIKHTVAMTGEITIQGRVLPIGGLREKAMAAYRNGIKEILIPYENLPDLEEVDKIVKDNVVFKPMKRVETALQEALVHLPEDDEK
jgi:ATP-dependent Lon protease